MQHILNRRRLLCVAHPMFILTLALLILTSTGFGQQTFVSKYDLYTGYAFLNSPRINLFQNGTQIQVGMRPRTWLSMGFDYSLTKGNLEITPELLPTDLQTRLGAQLGALAAAGRLPAGYHLSVPATSTTQTFAMGPQLAYRHFRRVTLFVRPSMGAIHEKAIPKPKDPIAAAIVAQLAPAGKKRDWQGFYGIGYGFDINLTNHFGIRTQGDLVWDHLFNDLLAQGRWTTRFSVGPCFNFGRNIAAKP